MGIGDFQQKLVFNSLSVNPLTSSSSSSDEHHVCIKSIHSSVWTYCVSDFGMKIGDIIENIRMEGSDGFEHKVTKLDTRTKSILNDKRPITLTCSRKRYNKEYLQYWAWEKRKEYKQRYPKGTPFIVACEKGNFDDVKLLFTNHDINERQQETTLKEMVNQTGKDSFGEERTAFDRAARYEHLNIVQYFIQECEAVLTIADSDGWMPLHYAALNNTK